MSVRGHIGLEEGSGPAAAAATPPARAPADDRYARVEEERRAADAEAAHLEARLRAVSHAASAATRGADQGDAAGQEQSGPHMTAAESTAALSRAAEAMEMAASQGEEQDAAIMTEQAAEQSRNELVPGKGLKDREMLLYYAKQAEERESMCFQRDWQITELQSAARAQDLARGTQEDPRRQLPAAKGLRSQLQHDFLAVEPRRQPRAEHGEGMPWVPPAGSELVAEATEAAAAAVAAAETPLSSELAAEAAISSPPLDSELQAAAASPPLRLAPELPGGHAAGTATAGTATGAEGAAEASNEAKDSLGLLAAGLEQAAAVEEASEASSSIATQQTLAAARRPPPVRHEEALQQAALSAMRAAATPVGAQGGEGRGWEPDSALDAKDLEALQERLAAAAAATTGCATAWDHAACPPGAAEQQLAMARQQLSA